MTTATVGTISIPQFTMTSSRGSANFALALINADIYESIFTPGILADFTVLDTDDILGGLIITGDEVINFSFQAPGSTLVALTLSLESVQDIQQAANQSMSSKKYMLRTVSKEALVGKGTRIQKSYNTTIDQIISDINTTYLKTTKTFIPETAKGSQNIIIPNMGPYEAIQMLTNRAISNQNKSSSYLYFENHNSSGQMQLNFQTVEGMFGGSIVKTFQQSDVVGSSIFNQDDNNILWYHLPQELSSLDRIDLGGSTRVSSFEYRTGTYASKNIVTSGTDYKSGGTGSYDSAQFIEQFQLPRIPTQSFIPVDTSQRAYTGIPDMISDKMAYAAVLAQNETKLTVPGDSQLSAGQLIFANIPNKIAITGNRPNEPLLSGNLLISKICHHIGFIDDDLRYLCYLDCLHGLLNQGVS